MRGGFAGLADAVVGREPDRKRNRWNELVVINLIVLDQQFIVIEFDEFIVEFVLDRIEFLVGWRREQFELVVQSLEQLEFGRIGIVAGGRRGRRRCAARAAGLDRDLENGFPDRAAPREGRVRVVREEDGERSFGHREPRGRLGGEEGDVARLVVAAARGSAAVGQRQPADLLVACHRVLDVDVAAMRFEADGLAPAAMLVVDRQVHPIAVHGVAPGRERAKVGVREKAETAFEERVQAPVLMAVRPRVEDHLLLFDLEVAHLDVDVVGDADARDAFD